MKNNILYVALILCMATPPAFAHRDRLGKISRAELTFQDGGTIIITQDRVALLSLALSTSSGSEKVNEVDLAGIEHIQFDTIQMTWSTFSSGELAGVPYKVIEFHFGRADQKSFGEYPTVRFHFWGNKYHHRGITAKVSENS